MLRSVKDKLLERCTPEPNTGCWLWLGRLNREGYGCVDIYSAEHSRFWPMLAHRVSYKTFSGAIPDGLGLDHLCRVRHCINPDHLEAVTIKINVLRGETVSAVNAEREVCINGHPFDLANTRSWFDSKTGRTHRVCRACTRERALAYYYRSVA